MIGYCIRTKRFWVYYFAIRILYLIFAIHIYGKLTQLGDTERYLNASLSSVTEFSFFITLLSYSKSVTSYLLLF